MTSKPYLIITGAHSTGKTSLIKALQPRLEEFYGERSLIIPEIPRFVNQLYRLPLNEQGTKETQFAIEKTYDTVEKLFSHMVLIADRGVIDRYAYTKANGLDLDDYYKTLLLVKAPMYTSIFYLPLEIGLEKDGVRSENLEYRKTVDRNIQTILKNQELPHYTLTGTINERAEKAIKFLEEEKKQEELDKLRPPRRYVR